jgi:hypothetical protein
MKTQRQAKTKPNWKIHAYYLDACNCDWGCPCQFNANPTHGNCEGLSGIHIIDGNFGDVDNNDIKLDGLNMAFIGSWPGPIHEGHGKASYYIDHRTNDSQFDVLSKIITGKAGRGGPFALYASIIEEYDEPRKARIRFEVKGIRSHMIIGNNNTDDYIVDAWLGPIRNPVTGKIHRAIIELPEGVEATRMDQASTKKLLVNDSHLHFRYGGTYGSFSENVWNGQ